MRGEVAQLAAEARGGRERLGVRAGRHCQRGWGSKGARRQCTGSYVCKKNTRKCLKSCDLASAGCRLRRMRAPPVVAFLLLFCDPASASIGVHLKCDHPGNRPGGGRSEILSAVSAGPLVRESKEGRRRSRDAPSAEPIVLDGSSAAAEKISVASMARGGGGGGGGGGTGGSSSFSPVGHGGPRRTIFPPFPVAKSELRHFLSMSSLMFLFIYVFTTVRDTKDTLVVSAVGAESLPLLKLFGVLPAAVAFITLYGRAGEVLGRDALFLCTLLPFFAFWAAFAFVLYPLREILHLDFGGGAGWKDRALGLIGSWTLSLFYIIGELWASAGIPLLFWKVANDVTSLDAARRFYPLFAVFGNFAPILSGKVTSLVIARNAGDGDKGFGRTLRTLAAVKMMACAGIVLLYKSIYADADGCARASERSVRSIGRDRAEVDDGMRPKKRVSLSESMRELSSSRYLRSIAVMVLCYNFCIELTELLWKALLRQSHPDKLSYMSYMARFSQTVGCVALALQLTASVIIRNLGWRVSALLTPLSMGLLAIPFFGSVAVGVGGGGIVPSPRPTLWDSAERGQ